MLKPSGWQQAIVVRGLSKTFQTPRGVVPALDGVDLEVREGEFLALVGPSGCGKTTLLRILAGLEHPTSGHLDVRHSDQRRPAIAMVFQGAALFPWMTVRENVAYGPRLRGVPPGQRRELADQLLALIGLNRFAEVYPHQLSEGMRQRVSIARALANNPQTLLMDEPFANLDEQNRLLLQQELLRLWEDTGRTVLFVTHSLQEAVVLADRVALFTGRPGRVKEVVPVPLPRPRRAEELYGSIEVAALVRRLWSSLREEVLRAQQKELA